MRAHFLTGAQDGPAPFPLPAGGMGQQPANPLEWWTMRALLVAMTDWVRKGIEPPATQVPKLSDGTLVPIAKLKWPQMPAAEPDHRAGARYDGKDLPSLVPQVDADGNELARIRTAEQRVPMATYTGWNFRSPAIGGTKQLVSLLGTAVPLARTKAEREKAGDPRLSLEERYPSREAYLAKASAAADALVKGRYLLAGDVPEAMARVEAQWTHEP